MGEPMSFRRIVDDFIDQLSESSMEALVESVRSQTPTDEEIAYFAKVCANTERVLWHKSDRAADVASTGGPTSLTTLVCPLYLRAFGHDVPKLGVPGRPAGGIDVLAQIPGYKFDLTDSEVATAMGNAGYAHFLAGKNQGNRDALFFEHRKKSNAVNLAPLVIASLLTKKLEVGLSRMGLDVRVAPFANFGRTFNEARANAQRFCSVARILDIEAVCFLTNGSVPYQPYIGRGESLVALSALLSDTSSPELNRHLNLCYAIASGTSGFEAIRPTAAQLRYHFANNLDAQGASLDSFFEKAQLIKNMHQFELTAPDHGFLIIDIERLRWVLTTHQKNLASEADPFPDPVGIILRASHQSFLSKGDLIATIRAPAGLWPRLHTDLAKALRISISDPGDSADNPHDVDFTSVYIKS